MKVFIASLLFLALSGIRVPASFAQQDQSYQKLAQEMEALKEHILTLQSQLQTVENTEKMKLSAELADAKTQLVNTEFEKFERNLKDSNDKWLFAWTGFFGVIIAVTLTIIGVALWFSIKSLIADRVEKNLNGFKKAVDQLDEIKNQLKVLQTGHAVSVLEHFIYHHPREEYHYREQTALIPEEALLQVFGDETRYMQLRLKAADVLAYRKSPLLVAPLLKLMNSVVDDDSDYNHHDIRNFEHELIGPLWHIHTQESYQGLKEFLNRLLTADSVYKRFLLTPTVFTLAKVSVELNKHDSVSILRKSIPDLEVRSYQEDALINLAEYFDTFFNEPEGVKEILNHIKGKMPNVVNRCLELLEKRNPQYVSDWREQNVEVNTETEVTS